MQAKILHSQIHRQRPLCYGFSMELNLRIRELRKAKGLTIGELADKVGVSTPHMSQVERGLKNLNNHLLTRIAAALEVQPEALISSSNRDDLGRLLDLIADLPEEDVERLRQFAEALRLSR